MNAISPTISDHLAAVFELRGNLWKAGFRPVPVYGPHASVPNPGKRPKGMAWQDLARQNPPFAVSHPPEPDACNTGLLCDGLRAIDIDVDDSDCVTKITTLATKIFGAGLIRRRSNSPRCLLLYRAAQGSPSKLVAPGTAGNVEVHGQGQQCVAFGTHLTGVPYEWTPNAPGEIHLEELVPVTEEQVANFLKEVGPLIGAETQATASSGPHLASTLGPTAALEDVEAALEVIPNDGPPNWEFWSNKIGLAIWHATMGSPQGYKVWRNWSAKHDSFNEIECQERWANYGKSPPNKIGAGTLFHLAKQAKPGWCNPSSIPAPESHKFGVPNMGVLTESNHPPPTLPISAFGNFWGPWIKVAAECANVPPDYVAVPLLATASALLGNARWTRAWDGWEEPPVLWCACVGEPSSGKSNGPSVVTNLLDEIETNLGTNYKNELLAWQDKATIAKLSEKQWRKTVSAALMEDITPPQKPKSAMIPEKPIKPRLSVTDTTIEELATIVSETPKGLLVRRDELSGWFANFSRYSNGSDRPFWLEATGGRPYRVDRVRLEEPTLIPHLSLAVSGTIQPDRLAESLGGTDDGLISRFLWCWPEPKLLEIPAKILGKHEAMSALQRLSRLELIAGADGVKRPHFVSLVEEARQGFLAFGKRVQKRETTEIGLMKSTLGKARGQTLRLALVLEYLRWSSQSGTELGPMAISTGAMDTAIGLMEDYFLPMATRVFGDAGVPQERRKAQTLLLWILKTHANLVNVSIIRDQAKLPGLRTNGHVKAACHYLEDALCLIPKPSTGVAGRPRGDFIVNPRIWDHLPFQQK